MTGLYKRAKGEMLLPMQELCTRFPHPGLMRHMSRWLISRNEERDKIVVVAEQKAAETTHKLNQFWYEAGQAVMQSTFEVQGRSLLYVQNTFKDGIETL